MWHIYEQFEAGVGNILPALGKIEICNVSAAVAVLSKDISTGNYGKDLEVKSRKKNNGPDGSVGGPDSFVWRAVDCRPLFQSNMMCYFRVRRNSEQA